MKNQLFIALLTAALGFAMLIWLPGAIAGRANATDTTSTGVNAFGTAKLQLLQQLQQQADQRAAGPRLSPQEITNPDPAGALNVQPAVRFISDSAPCPAAAGPCERMGASLAGNGTDYIITDYFMGGTFSVYAGTTLQSPEQGFIMINSERYSLPQADGVPSLTSVTGNPSKGNAEFTTSTGATGSINLATGAVTLDG